MRWVLQKTKHGLSGRRTQPATGTAFGGGDGGRNTSDEPPWGSRKAVNPYTRLVCSKPGKCGGGEREPPNASCSVRGTSPLETLLSARDPIPRKAVLSVRGTSPPKPTPEIGEEGGGSLLVRRR